VALSKQYVKNIHQQIIQLYFGSDIFRKTFIIGLSNYLLSIIFRNTFLIGLFNYLVVRSFPKYIHHLIIQLLAVSFHLGAAWLKLLRLKVLLHMSELEIYKSF
jgi:hypothetical protein